MPGEYFRKITISSDGLDSPWALISCFRPPRATSKRWYLSVLRVDPPQSSTARLSKKKRKICRSQVMLDTPARRCDSKGVPQPRSRPTLAQLLVRFVSSAQHREARLNYWSSPGTPLPGFPFLGCVVHAIVVSVPPVIFLIGFHAGVPSALARFPLSASLRSDRIRPSPWITRRQIRVNPVISRAMAIHVAAAT